MKLNCPPEFETATGIWEDCGVPNHCAGCGCTLAEHLATDEDEFEDDDFDDALDDEEEDDEFGSRGEEGEDEVPEDAEDDDDDL